MTKPTEQPRWASTGGADVTEPASGVKDTGYIDAGVPDAGELNWLLNRTYLWTTWLAAFESTVHTWTATQTFDAAVFNSITIGALAIDSTGALSIDGSGLVELGTDGSVGCVDLTVNHNLIVNNASALTTGSFSGALGLNGFVTAVAGVKSTATGSVPGFEGLGNGIVAGVWGKSSAAANAVGVRATILSSAPSTARGLKVYKQSAGDASVPDTSVTDPLVDIAGALQFSGVNPAKTAASLNSVTGLNTCKAHAKITQNNTASPVFDDGFNVASVVETLPLGAFTVTFAHPMANADYTVNVTCDNDSGTVFMVPKIEFRTTTSFVIQAYKIVADTTASSTETNGNVWNITVFGRQ